MFVIDLQPIMLASLFVQREPVTEDFMRHLVLNSLKTYFRKFRDEFGQGVIACDAKKSWRYEVFPYYKAHRKKAREKTGIDWPEVFRTFDLIKTEMRQVLKYPVIEVPGAEADDVIAALAHKYAGGENGEPFMIVSRDRDFIQLQTLGKDWAGMTTVSQWDPIDDKLISHPDPGQYLWEQIIRGDDGDGVPNVLSPPDCKVRGIRQKMMTEKKLKEIFSYVGRWEFPTDELKTAMERNVTLIDLRGANMPGGPGAGIWDKVYAEFDAQKGKSSEGVYNYFVEKKLRNLMEHVGDFL